MLKIMAWLAVSATSIVAATHLRDQPWMQIDQLTESSEYGQSDRLAATVRSLMSLAQSSGGGGHSERSNANKSHLPQTVQTGGGATCCWVGESVASDDCGQ